MSFNLNITYDLRKNPYAELLSEMYLVDFLRDYKTLKDSRTLIISVILYWRFFNATTLNVKTDVTRTK